MSKTLKIVLISILVLGIIGVAVFIYISNRPTPIKDNKNEVAKEKILDQYRDNKTKEEEYKELKDLYSKMKKEAENGDMSACYMENAGVDDKGTYALDYDIFTGHIKKLQAGGTVLKYNFTTKSWREVKKEKPLDLTGKNVKDYNQALKLVEPIPEDRELYSKGKDGAPEYAIKFDKWLSKKYPAVYDNLMSRRVYKVGDNIVACTLSNYMYTFVGTPNGNNYDFYLTSLRGDGYNNFMSYINTNNMYDKDKAPEERKLNPPPGAVLNQ